MMAVLLTAVFLPLLAGALLPLLRFGAHRTARAVYVGAIVCVEFAAVLYLALQPELSLTLWQITGRISIGFHVDAVSRIFTLFAAGLWVPVAFFAFRYMEHEQSEDRFFTFFLLAEGMLIGMDYASNLVCMYVFYELAALSALPLVLHTQQKEAVAAALKYLFYSIAGAFMALFGIVFLQRFCTTLEFVPGGSLNLAKVGGHETLLQIVSFAIMLGFGVKAGLYPLHGWLPAAHPVAPAPASALLSAVIAKSGVLGILRALYFVIGAEFLIGSWVQYTLLSLAILTVFMGSMMAYREPVLKRRLAFSTVSQISYILFGLFLMTAQGVLGALLHLIFHAVIKCGLFLVAGAIIFRTGRTRVDEITGIGKQMPVTLWCFTLLSLALVGIPPCSGFVSKWFLAEASLASATGPVTWLGPVVLLVSALLTAGYLLPITLRGFFPGSSVTYPVTKTEAAALMWVPLVVLAALAVGLGMFPEGLLSWLTALSGRLV